VNVFYVLIRTTENYEFDKIRTAGVTGSATNYKNSQGDNLICSTEMKSRSPPGQFHHEPPLNTCMHNRHGGECVTDRTVSYAMS